MNFKTVEEQPDQLVAETDDQAWDLDLDAESEGGGSQTAAAAMHSSALEIQAVLAVGAAEGPCDITGKAGNPCVAAHSTTRALYAAYNGPLYRVTRSSDGKSTTVGVLSPGGYANITTHEAFCPKLNCVISNVFDQSPMGNHLSQRHKLVNASQHKITVGKDNAPVYGMFFDPGYGHHVDETKGIAKGNEPESIFAVMSGTHYNGKCCFDYGNSENSIIAQNRSDGAGAMEASALVVPMHSLTHACHSGHLLWECKVARDLC